jgi:hypothetical protein
MQNCRAVYFLTKRDSHDRTVNMLLAQHVLNYLDLDLDLDRRDGNGNGNGNGNGSSSSSSSSSKAKISTLAGGPKVTKGGTPRFVTLPRGGDRFPVEETWETIEVPAQVAAAAAARVWVRA